MNRVQTKAPTTKLLLSLLSQSGQAMIDFYTFIYNVRYHRGTYMRGGSDLVRELKRLQSASVAKLALKRLRQANYIKAQKIGQRLMVSLTTKGLSATLSTKLRQAPACCNKFYTVVIFDIPESQSLARRQFRWLLRQGGFTRLQQSVWVSKRDAYDLIAKFIRQTKIEPWVNLFRSTDFLQLPKQ